MHIFFTFLNQSDHILIEAIEKYEKNCKAYNEGVIRRVINKILDEIIKIEEKKKNEEKA